MWYLCEVGVLRTRQDASEERRTVETNHGRHHQITEFDFKDIRKLYYARINGNKYEEMN